MTLNRADDGPLAYGDQDEMTQYDAAEWLIDYVNDNNNSNDGSWSDWTDADYIITTYLPAYDADGKITSPNETDDPVQKIEIGERAREILDACIAGGDPKELMDAWREEMLDAVHSGPSM